MPYAGARRAARLGRPQTTLKVPLALFHRPPVTTHATGTLLMAAASTPSLVVFANGDETYLAAMRAAGYGGDALQYVLCNQLYGANGTGAAEAAPPTFIVYDNQFGYVNGDYSGLADASLLHNGAGADPYVGLRVGARVYKIHADAVQGDQYDHAVKPDGAAWMTLRNTRANGWANDTSRPYAGFFLDNIDYEYAVNRFDPAQYATGTWNKTLVEYADVPSDQSAYKTAVVTGLSNLRTNLAASKLPTNSWANRVWGNLTTPEPPTLNDEWSALRPYLDGFLFESFALNWSTQATLASWRSQAVTETQMANITTWLTAGKKVIVVVQGNHSADPDPNQQFALCLFWLLYQPGAYFRWAPDDSSGYLSWRHYANYQLDLGTPLEPRSLVSATKYVRRFTKKTVTADFATHTGTIV